MKYQVPQFIGIEDKIFGPLTFKQFVYVAGSIGLAFLGYRLLPIYLGIFVVIPALALGAALAFYRPNDKPFVEVLESAFKFYGGGRLYVWKKTDKKPQASTLSLADKIPAVALPKLSENKLRDLTWSLDINESLYSQEENTQRENARSASAIPDPKDTLSLEI